MIEEITKVCVAQIVGSDGPGFRNSFRNAERQGVFDDARTIGDFAIAYMEFQIEQIRIIQNEN